MELSQQFHLFLSIFKKMKLKRKEIYKLYRVNSTLNNVF